MNSPPKNEKNEIKMKTLLVLLFIRDLFEMLLITSSAANSAAVFGFFLLVKTPGLKRSQFNVKAERNA